MPSKAVRIKTEPDTYAPFNISQAYQVGDLIFVSGQAALSREGEVVGVGDFDKQADCTLKNLEWVESVITILDIPLLNSSDESLTERLKNFQIRIT